MKQLKEIYFNLDQEYLGENLRYTKAEAPYLVWTRYNALGSNLYYQAKDWNDSLYVNIGDYPLILAFLRLTGEMD